MDRFLDVAVDDVSERYWAIVNHFEEVPIFSVYKSPVILFPKNLKNKSFHLISDSLIPDYTRLEMAYRFGVSGKDNKFEWSQWKPLEANPGSGPFPIEADHFQWKTEFYGWKQKNPILKDVRLRLLE